MEKFKFTNLLLLIAVAFTSILSGCSNDEPSGPVDNYANIATSDNILFTQSTQTEKQIGNGDTEFCFTGDQTLEKGTYILKGWVYLRPGSKLTIQPGTVIKGDKDTKASLIVEPGATLIAQGNANNPIVFTSAQAIGQRRPGDWGGLIICGKARNNINNDMQIEGGPKTHHGGTDDDDNSGIISYVRVEFAGYPFAKDKEINGITFGSVGRGTQIDHLQVSYSNDDSYEWFGGSVNCKYLVAYNGWDDEFDTDNGFSGHVQFCLSVRDPKIADVSQSNGFESDNNADGAVIDPTTKAIFSNVTFIGPATKKNSDFQNTVQGMEGISNPYINGGNVYPNNGSGLGRFQAAMQIRRSSNLNCINSVAVGWPIGLILDGEKGNTVESAKNNKIILQNIIFAGMTALGSDANKEYRNILGTYSNGKVTFDESKESYSATFFKAQPGNKELTEEGLLLTDPQNVGQNYAPQAGSPLLNGASFNMLSSNFLKTNISYIGAFSENDSWMEGWTNFDPQNTPY